MNNFNIQKRIEEFSQIRILIGDYVYLLSQIYFSQKKDESELIEAKISLAKKQEQLLLDKMQRLINIYSDYQPNFYSQKEV